VVEAELNAESAPAIPPDDGVLDSVSSVSAMVVVLGVEELVWRWISAG